MLPISVKYLCRSSKCRADLWRYLKRFMKESRLLPSSQISGRMYNTVVSIKCMMWKACRSPTLCRYLKLIIDFKWQKHGSLRSLGLLQDGACTELFENFRENSLKGDLSNDIFVNPPLFSLVNTFKKVESFWCALSKSQKCVVTLFYSPSDNTSTAATVTVTTGGLLRGKKETKKNNFANKEQYSTCRYSYGSGSGSIVTWALAQHLNTILRFWWLTSIKILQLFRP
jgi:hypothetical protein